VSTIVLNFVLVKRSSLGFGPELAFTHGVLCLHSFLYSGVWDSVSDPAAAGFMCSVHSTITSSYNFLDQQLHAPYWTEEVRRRLHILMIILSAIISLLRMLV